MTTDRLVVGTRKPKQPREPEIEKKSWPRYKDYGFKIERAMTAARLSVKECAAITGLGETTIKTARAGDYIRLRRHQLIIDAIEKRLPADRKDLARIQYPWTTRTDSQARTAEVTSVPMDFPFDTESLTDPLIGLSLADRRTQPEWNFAFENAQQRLIENPEDTFLRAMLVWSTLLKGDPDQVIKVIQDIAMWLQSDFTENSGREIRQWVKRKELWLNKITGIRERSIEDPEWVRVVLEDTLVREALLRWLKTSGRFSPLAERIRSIKTCGLSNNVKTIFENAKRRRDVENWVSGAIDDANNWISAIHSLGLPRVYLMWLTGRDLKSRNQIPSLIQFALDWLENHKNINDTLVRWASIWLAGMLASNQYVSLIVQQTSKWLRSPASKGDRLVRWAYLWFVGAQGNRKQLNSAIAETTKWLNDSRHHDDTTVRLALLFSMRRAEERGIGTAKQLQKIIDDLCPLVKEDQLIELSVHLTQCSLPTVR